MTNKTDAAHRQHPAVPSNNVVDYARYSAEIMTALAQGGNLNADEVQLMLRRILETFIDVELANSTTDGPTGAIIGENWVQCLECGARRQNLYRHLEQEHGMTADAYRRKHRLPEVFPLCSLTELRSKYSVPDEHKQRKHQLASDGRPFVPLHESITKEFFICLEDGKKVKQIGDYVKRHFELSADEYRGRWKLPHRYPMNLSTSEKKLENLKADLRTIHEANYSGLERSSLDQYT